MKTMQRVLCAWIAAAVLAAGALADSPRAAERQALDVYFVDVEGGQATLVVSPSGESMLFDAGWPGFEGRDADRIVAAARDAGVSRIDYMVTTHYHVDHAGGVPEVAARLPVRTFVDHGDTTETGANAERLFEAYAQVRARGRHLVVTPGDVIPVTGLEALVVTARGERIGRSVAGQPAANPLCAAAERKADDPGENARSIGVVLQLGAFRLLNLGDLTWNKELELVCPENLLGAIDVYLTTHHGLASSNPPALVHAVRPRVAVMNNGAKKGGAPEAWQIIRKAPGLEDLWQLHYAEAGGATHNAPETFIANLDETTGHWIKLSARPDGSFTVTNGRNGFTKEYGARR
jgi:competence protein ComEC